MEELIAALYLQLADRDEHIGSLGQLIELLSQQLADKETMISELEARAMFLEQANTQLSEKIQQQDTLIADLQREMIADKKQLAKLAKEADKVAGLRHSRKLIADERHGHKSERIYERLDKSGFIAETGLTAKDYDQLHKSLATGKFAHITEKPNPKLFEQGLDVVEKVLEPAGIDTSLYKCVGQKDTYKIVRRKAVNYVLKIIRPIYLEETDQLRYKHKQHIAPLPEGQISRCFADITLMNLFLTDKFLYHMPLNRIRTKLIREGLTIPYSTINRFI